MKILHIAPSLNREWGGPPRVVIGMAKALVKKGIKVSVFTTAEKGKRRRIVRLNNITTQIFERGSFSRFWTSYSPGVTRVMVKEIENCDLVHIHELWHYLHYVGYKTARKQKKPYGISVHGQLAPWDLSRKAFRKSIYSMFVQKKILEETAFLHAITEEEVKDIRKYGVSNNIFVIPNGINLEDFLTLSRVHLDLPKLQNLQNKKIVLFLGRIHPTKGLDLLAKAWGQIAKGRNDLVLVIAGPDTDGYKSKIEGILKSKGVMDKVIFLGMVEEDEKKIILERADIVVIPSYSEVRSLVALEAMISQKPIIITNKCHFPEISEVAAGIIIEPKVEQLEKALSKLLVNPEMRKKMGQNGRILVMERYTWDKIVNRLIEIYKYAVEKNKTKEA